MVLTAGLVFRDNQDEIVRSDIFHALSHLSLVVDAALEGISERVEAEQRRLASANARIGLANESIAAMRGCDDRAITIFSSSIFPGSAGRREPPPARGEDKGPGCVPSAFMDGLGCERSTPGSLPYAEEAEGVDYDVANRQRDREAERLGVGFGTAHDLMPQLNAHGVGVASIDGPAMTMEREGLGKLPNPHGGLRLGSSAGIGVSELLLFNSSHTPFKVEGEPHHSFHFVFQKK